MTDLHALRERIDAADLHELSCKTATYRMPRTEVPCNCAAPDLLVEALAALDELVSLRAEVERLRDAVDGAITEYDGDNVVSAASVIRDLQEWTGR